MPILLKVWFLWIILLKKKNLISKLFNYISSFGTQFNQSRAICSNHWYGNASATLAKLSFTLKFELDFGKTKFQKIYN